MDEADRSYVVDKVLYTDHEKFFQYRLTVSDFRGQTYLNIRKYFMDFEGEYIPSKEGATFPLTLDSLSQLMDGLFEILSEAEAHEAITNYLTSKLPAGGV